jgi:opacity protein-like surface antigen
MRTYLLAAVAAAAVATPAVAKDNSGYVGVEGGVLFPRSQNGDFAATFGQSAQSPAAGTTAPLPGTGLVGALPVGLATPPAAIAGGSRVRWKTGYDVDLIGGYDFGMFRLEGELGYKRSKLKNFRTDTAFGSAVDAALNPAGTTGTAFAFPVDDESAFGINNHVSVLSGMVNALLDVGGDAGVGGYVGAGFGRARVKELGDSDSAWAWQGIAGVRFPVSANIDIGLKYRYFRTGHLNFDAGAATFAGSTRTVAVPNTGVGATGSTNVTFTRTAAITGAFDDHFASHSLLLSLVYNFGGVAEAPPPPPPPPPPPVEAPATQTCPDGSVILATSTCPAPPPPPPPPPVERGERGK